MLEQYPSNALSPRFQTISLSITTIIIFGFLYRLMTVFCSLDQRPELAPLTPEILAPLNMPPAQVKVGLSVTDFSEFNIVENNFVFSGVIWFEFDPSIISLESIDKFSFERGQIESKSEPYTYLVGDKLFARYSIRVRFKTNLSYRYFPFEDHKIHLVLINNLVTIGEMVFESSYNNFRVSSDLSLAGWKYYDRSVQSGYGTTIVGSTAHEKTVYYPRVIFELDYLRNSVRYVITVILPLLLVFFLEMFSLCVDQREQRGTLIGLSATNMAALFAYRFVIENISPKVGYLMLSDYFFFLFLGTSFAMFIINGAEPYLSIFQKKMVSIGFQSAVIVTLLSLFRFFVIC